MTGVLAHIVTLKPNLAHSMYIYVTDHVVYVHMLKCFLQYMSPLYQLIQLGFYALHTISLPVFRVRCMKRYMYISVTNINTIKAYTARSILYHAPKRRLYIVSGHRGIAVLKHRVSFGKKILTQWYKLKVGYHVRESTLFYTQDQISRLHLSEVVPGGGSETVRGVFCVFYARSYTYLGNSLSSFNLRR